MMKIIYNKEKRYYALVAVGDNDKKYYVTFDKHTIFIIIKTLKLDKTKLYQDGVIELA